MNLDTPIYKYISVLALETNIDAYLVGGIVRDSLLNRENKDVDIVLVNKNSTLSNVDMSLNFAKQVGENFNVKVTLFDTYGTAMLKYDNIEYEFVGARKESYPDRNSRNPKVEDGTLEDDQIRRDFNMNALFISLNSTNYGDLIDPLKLGGEQDIKDKIIKSNNPDQAYSDDPLRMMRAIRFASQLNFIIEKNTFDAIGRNKDRLNIITQERITNELNKILLSPNSGYGFQLLLESGLLELILPELTRLNINRDGEKNVMWHIIAVLKLFDLLKTIIKIQPKDILYFAWALVLHDTGKFAKRTDINGKIAFHNHQVESEKIVDEVFRRLKLPLTESTLGYTKFIVRNHERIKISIDVTDTAIRALGFEFKDLIWDMLFFGMCDQSTSNPEKQHRVMNQYLTLYDRYLSVSEEDRKREFKIPIKGNEIIELYNPQPKSIIGEILTEIKNAIISGECDYTHESSYSYMVKIAEEKYKLNKLN